MSAILEQRERPAGTTRPFEGPSIGRLVKVELRKMTDTRAGFWLLIATALVAAGTVTLILFAGDTDEKTLGGFFSPTVELTSVLLPVLGILAVTSEWSQRTALTTFTLVPRRERVIAAKVLAGVALSAVAVVVCLEAAAVGNVLAPLVGDADGSWSLGLERLGGLALYMTIGLMGGLAFGLALMSSALAIVLYFLLPTVFAVLAETISSFRGIADWLDLSTTLEPLADASMTSEGWAQLGTAVAVWVVLPFVIGLVRLRRTELA